jgi:hypothetical protein
LSGHASCRQGYTHPGVFVKAHSKGLASALGVKTDSKGVTEAAAEERVRTRP